MVTEGRAGCGLGVWRWQMETMFRMDRAGIETWRYSGHREGKRVGPTETVALTYNIRYHV